MKKRYYVYAHYKENGELFYVGKGTKDRDISCSARSKEWLNEASGGFTSVIVADDLSNKHAFLIEQSLIRALNPTNLANKKVPSDVVKPYWKKTRKLRQVSTTTNIDDAIICIKEQLKKKELTKYEQMLIQTSSKKIEEDLKPLRVKAQVKLQKYRELSKRLDRAYKIKNKES